VDKLSSREDPGTINRLRQSFLEGIREQAGEGAAAQAQALVDYVQAVMSPEQASDVAIFKDQLVSRSVPFVQQSVDVKEKHLRLMGISHLLANLLRPAVETTEDEYITSRFEELTERLSCLERVDMTNPSLDNRLTTVYRGLVELASALGLSTCDAFCLL
jgi:hypothetical protein